MRQQPFHAHWVKLAGACSCVQVLEGDRLVSTPYKIMFRKDVETEVLCTKTLNKADLHLFREAVKQDYYFQVCGGWAGRVQ